MKKFLAYLNPVLRLGVRKYSAIFPFTTVLATCILSELFAYGIAKNPNIVGVYIIFVNVAFIIYFSFHDGIIGGFISTTLTILYYFYIIISRHYKGDQFVSGVETTIFLAFLYLVLGTIIGWLKQTIDALIHREADEKRRLQTVVQQLPVGVIITDSKGRIVQTNKQCDAILGVKVPIGFYVGKSNTETTESTPNIYPGNISLAHVITTGRSMVNREYTIQHKSGKKKYLQISATPIHNAAGKIIAAASIITDITQQKEIESRKDDFVNMASHELKTPITSMKIFIDLLMNRVKKNDDEKSMRMLFNIKKQTDKLQGLVNDLLDVSRLQTGKLSFTKEKFNLIHCIQETIEGLQGAANTQKITCSSHSPLQVYADRFRIYQVLTNLITNAMKYSQGKGDIIISASRKDGKAVVSVQDFGIGIAKEQQKKIFDRLYQVTDHRIQTFPGFGMGLYISKEIVKRHKGKIWVESEKNNGATFYFTLPL